MKPINETKRQNFEKGQMSNVSIVVFDMLLEKRIWSKQMGIRTKCIEILEKNMKFGKTWEWSGSPSSMGMTLNVKLWNGLDTWFSK